MTFALGLGASAIDGPTFTHGNLRQSTELPAGLLEVALANGEDVNAP